MTEDTQPRDDERFQEVLGRLDALVRRGHGDIEPPLPPPAVSEATIPVLTDVYQPDQTVHAALEITAPEPGAVQKNLEQIVAEILPEVSRMLEEALLYQVRPMVDVALDEAIANLRPQIDVVLRERLQQALAPKE